MAEDLGGLAFTLTLNDEGFASQLAEDTDKVQVSGEKIADTNENVADTSNKAGSAFGNMAGQFVVGQAIFTAGQKALDLVKTSIGDAIQATKDWQQQQQGLQAVLKSTNDASGLSAEEVMKLAENIQATTPISREAALTGDNMLLTFRQIGSDVFPAASQAVADMATRLNGGLIPSAQQMSQQALMLGKAINDPTQGLTLLRREGVTFTEQQKEQIKTMQANGNIMGAQKLMLAELSAEFGGSAAANVKTFDGQIAMLKNRFNDLVGGAIVKLLDVLKQFAEFLFQHKELLAAVAGVIAALVILIGIALVHAIWLAVAAMLTGLAPALLLIIPIAAAIGFIAYEIISHWNQLKLWFSDFVSWLNARIEDVKTLFEGFTTGLGMLRDTLVDWGNNVLQVIEDIGKVIAFTMIGIAAIIFLPVTIGLVMWHFFHAQITGIFTALLGFIKNVMIVVAAIILLPLVPIVLAWRAWHQQIIQIFEDTVSAIKAVWDDIVGFFDEIIGAMLAVFNSIKNVIIDIFLFEWKGMTRIWSALEPYFADIINGVKAIFGTIIGFIVGVWQKAWDGMTSLWSSLTSFFGGIIKDVGKAVTDGVKNFGTLLFDAGKSLIEGLVNGIKSAAGAATDAVKNVGSGILNAAKSVLKVFSPSKAFAEIGQNVTLGLAQGIQGTTSTAVNATRSVANAVLGTGKNALSSPMGGQSGIGLGNIHYHIDSVNLTTKEATDEFFSIGNRNSQLELMGGSPLAGTTKV